MHIPEAEEPLIYTLSYHGKGAHCGQPSHDGTAPKYIIFIPSKADSAAFLLGKNAW